MGHPSTNKKGIIGLILIYSYNVLYIPQILQSARPTAHSEPSHEEPDNFCADDEVDEPACSSIQCASTSTMHTTGTQCSSLGKPSHRSRGNSFVDAYSVRVGEGRGESAWGTRCTKQLNYKGVSQSWNYEILFPTNPPGIDNHIFHCFMIFQEPCRWSHRWWIFLLRWEMDGSVLRKLMPVASVTQLSPLRLWLPLLPENQTGPPHVPYPRVLYRHHPPPLNHPQRKTCFTNHRICLWWRPKMRSTMCPILQWSMFNHALLQREKNNNKPIYCRIICSPVSQIWFSSFCPSYI